MTTDSSSKRKKQREPSIITKADRARLRVQREPHWLRLGPGAYLGFRRGADTWCARYRDRQGDQHFTSFGQSDDFQAMRDAAQQWCDQMAGAVASVPQGSPKAITVRDAVATYLEHLRRSGRGSAAVVADQKFGSTLYADPLADVRLIDVTREDVERYRERLRDGGRRQNQSVNRYMTCLSAALNCAVEVRGLVGNVKAWRLERLPVAQKESTAPDATVYLDAAQRARLLKHAEPALQSYLRAVFASAARPDEIARATVADYDRKANTLTLRCMKGRPAMLRPRSVQLHPDDAAMFRDLCKDKHPNAWLVTDENGQQWQRHRWSKQIRAAIAYANAKAKDSERIPEGASAYSFRHARISELLQIYGVDPVTVAHQTGTSLAMMQLYYWKFIPSAIIEKFTGGSAQAKKRAR